MKKEDWTVRAMKQSAKHRPFVSVNLVHPEVRLKLAGRKELVVQLEQRRDFQVLRYFMEGAR